MKSDKSENKKMLIYEGHSIRVTKRLVKFFFFLCYGIHPHNNTYNYYALRLRPQTEKEIKKKYCGTYVFQEIKNTKKDKEPLLQ